jgi:hypothetical protein
VTRTPVGAADELARAFHAYASAQLARLLTQMDRDPDSPTFGSFDRPYWHYKVHDFPSAILQQGLFVLEAIRSAALPTPAPTPVVERWCLGAVQALTRQVRRGGDVDEYYPFERSYPAAAFGLYAVARVLVDWHAKAPRLAGAVDRPRLAALARHVAAREERQASNQQAAGLAGLALAVRGGLLPASVARVEAHADRLFAAQHPEGWFEEYGGPDFGYLSVTLDALADYHDATGDARALAAADRAVDFLAGLVGADGRLPSTLNSRNTDYVVPYGLVRTGARNPRAAWLVARLFAGLDGRDHPIRATDDRYHAHYVFASIVRSLPHLAALVPAEPVPPAGERWLPGCGYWVVWAPDGAWTAYVAARKGGLVRIHRAGGRPPVVEHGWRIHAPGRLWTTNWWSPAWRVAWEPGRVRVEGRCQRGRFRLPTPLRHVALRLLARLVGARLVPLLKRALIFRPGPADGPDFARTVEMGPDGVRLVDRLGGLPGGVAAPGPRQNLRHVASADSFSPEEWRPSLLGADALPLDRPCVVERRWRAADAPD